jgi:anti-sigma-K factor RskA
MGVSDVPRRQRGHRWSARWAVAGVAAAAAAVAALGVGLGLTLTSSPAPLSVAQGHGHGVLESHNLIQDGRTVGHVVYFDGAKPWMSMMLADPGVQGQVDCVVISKNGVTHWLGTFTAHDGSGAWFATLHVNPDTFRTAQVVSPSGAVLARASLT